MGLENSIHNSQFDAKTLSYGCKNRKRIKSGRVITQEESQELKEEIAFKEKGEYILDGVLWYVGRRKSKESWKAEMQAILKKEQQIIQQRET